MLVFDSKRPFVFEKITCDKRRIMQIILNFLSNAIKFTPQKGNIKLHLNILEE